MVQEFLMVESWARLKYFRGAWFPTVSLVIYAPGKNHRFHQKISEKQKFLMIYIIRIPNKISLKKYETLLNYHFQFKSYLFFINYSWKMFEETNICDEKLSENDKKFLRKQVQLIFKTLLHCMFLKFHLEKGNKEWNFVMLMK